MIPPISDLFARPLFRQTGYHVGLPSTTGSKELDAAEGDGSELQLLEHCVSWLQSTSTDTSPQTEPRRPVAGLENPLGYVGVG